MSVLENRIEKLKLAMELKDCGEVLCKHVATPEMAIGYSGYSLYEGLWDSLLIADAMKKLLSDFPEADLLRSVFYRSPRFYSSIGAKSFVQSEEGFLQHPEVHSMQETEYAEYNENPFDFILKKVLPRFFDVFELEEPYRSIGLAKGVIVNNNVFGPYRIKMAEVLKELNIPAITNVTALAPFDFIADYLRGFTGIVGDSRRHKNELYEACEKTLPLIVQKAFASPKGVENMIFIPLHMPPFISDKIFADLWWPSFKEMAETFADAGYCMNIFFEGDWTRYIDYLQELPQKKILGRFEYTEPKLAKEKLGNVMCLQGFYPMTMLTGCTKEACTDKAKQLLDTVAVGGGYIFNFDKLTTSANDIDVSNLHAVYECVKTYGRS